MSQIYEVCLRVREADEADHGRSVIRIHKTDKPKGLRWGDKINISLDKKNWVSCKLEPAGDIGIGKIYISIHLRGLINKDTHGIPIAMWACHAISILKKRPRGERFFTRQWASC